MLYNIKGRYYVIQKRRNKMSLILNVQLSAFSNYRIEPTANNVTFLMESINKLGIKEFLPNITTGQNIDLIKGKLETISNLGFVTSDKTGQIICQNNRIVCLFNYVVFILFFFYVFFFDSCFLYKRRDPLPKKRETRSFLA